MANRAQKKVKTSLRARPMGVSALKEKSNQQETLFLVNLQLLGFKKHVVNARYQNVSINEHTFTVANQPAAQMVMYFLFEKLDEEKAKYEFRHCYPVTSKVEEGEFRSKCKQWLQNLNKVDPKSYFRTERVTSALMSACGSHILEFLVSFSLYVLEKQVLFKAGKRGIEVLCPPPDRKAKDMQKLWSFIDETHRYQTVENMDNMLHLTQQLAENDNIVDKKLQLMTRQYDNYKEMIQYSQKNVRELLTAEGFCSEAVEAVLAGQSHPDWMDYKARNMNSLAKIKQDCSHFDAQITKAGEFACMVASVLKCEADGDLQLSAELLGNTTKENVNLMDEIANLNQPIENLCSSLQSGLEHLHIQGLKLYTGEFEKQLQTVRTSRAVASMLNCRIENSIKCIREAKRSEASLTDLSFNLMPPTPKMASIDDSGLFPENPLHITPPFDLYKTKLSNREDASARSKFNLEELKMLETLDTATKTLDTPLRSQILLTPRAESLLVDVHLTPSSTATPTLPTRKLVVTARGDDTPAMPSATASKMLPQQPRRLDLPSDNFHDINFSSETLDKLEADLSIGASNIEW